MSHKPLIVANWKMYMPYNDVRTYLELYTENLVQLAENSGMPIILCPSAESLSLIREYMQDTIIMYGAQTCSTHTAGPYTGETSAISLKQLGCSYCLVGHHERRVLFHETDSIIRQKTTHLLQENIIPILCVGETEHEYKKNKSLDIINKQLNAIIPCYDTHQTIIIAYEPGWAIGTGITPATHELNNIITSIKNKIKETGHQAHILYGGSVNENTIQSLSQTPSLDGYLIGSASIDFKKLKNIVSLICK